MKLLVTGGAGFIGSNFIHHILETYPDYQITNLDALTYAGNVRNCERWDDDARYTFVKGDICDAELVDTLVADADIVVHFAAESHVDRSILSAADFVRTNVLGTQTLLDAALKNGKKRFHHVSTDEVFGHLEMSDPAFTEETPYAPRSPYSASKAASDHLVRAYFHTHALPITITNCTNNYGPYLFPEKLISLAITNVMEGKKVPVYGKGDQVRDWLFVADHCRAIDLVIHKGRAGETYGVGGDNQPTNLSIVEKVIDLLGADRASSIEFVTDRPGHDFRYDIDYTKIKEELGWESSVTLDEGLAQTVQWYKDNEQWWRDIKSGATKNITKKIMGSENSAGKIIQGRDINGNPVDLKLEDLSFRPSIYGVVIQDDKILLVPQFGDGYDFPGGGIDLGESFEDALKREVKEETGLNVKLGELLCAETDLFYSTMKKRAMHSILLFYKCHDPQGEISTDGFDKYEKEYAEKAEWIDIQKIDTLKFYNPIDSPALIRKAIALQK